MRTRTRTRAKRKSKTRTKTRTTDDKINCLFVGINGAGRLLQVRRSMNRRMEYGGVEEDDA